MARSAPAARKPAVSMGRGIATVYFLTRQRFVRERSSMKFVRRPRVFLALLTLLLASGRAPAQTSEGSKGAAKDAKDTKSAQEKSLSDRFEGLEFRTIGPFRGGRVTAVSGVRSEPQTFYMGATGGGVWKTTDGGSNWQALSDKDFKTGSIGE